VHFTEEKLEKWSSLPQDQLVLALHKVYEKLGLSDEEVSVLERNFFSPQPPPPNPVSRENTKPEIITPILVQEKIPVAQQPQTIPVQQPSIDIDSIHKKEQEKKRISEIPIKKRNTTFYYFIGAFMSIAAYLGYQYLQFNKHGMAYPLTDNIAVREQDLETSENIQRLDLFGSFMDKNGVIQSSLDQLKIIDDDANSNFYKVQTKADFVNYLLGKDAAYVHKNMVSQDRAEWNQYRNVFRNIASDYNELDKLQRVYRKMIVQAISKYNDLSGLTIASSCNVEKKLKANAPLSIGQYVKKDEHNNIDGRYAIARMTNGNYYTIIADKNGNVSEVKQTILITNDHPIALSEPGKFKYYDPYDMTYGDFIWKSCDGKYEARSMTEPFDQFRLK
jgi:hypothetical protein